MGFEQLLSRINFVRKELHMWQKVPLNKRDANWYSQYKKVQLEYQESLNKFKFGLMKFDYKYNLDKINNANKINFKDDFNDTVFQNLLLNNSLARDRNMHPLIYTINDENGVVYQVVKTHSQNAIKQPIKDEMFDYKQGSTKVYEILKETYLSDTIYILQLKDKNEIDKVIQNIEGDELLMNKYFHNLSARCYQKEKVFEMLYKKSFNEDPQILKEDIHPIDKDLLVDTKMPYHIYLVDVTNNSYIDDHIYIIANYEKYRVDSWTEYLKIYEAEDLNLNKNDKDI